MKIIKKPYKISPYEEIKSMKPTWLKEVETLIDKKIKAAKNQLEEEAEYDGQPELNDDKFLYERYKENSENNMYFGNWQVLKYFYRKMKIKLYEVMRGNWLFTDNDVEMYNYFLNLKVSEDIKCKPAFLKIKSGTEVKEDDLIYDNRRFYVYHEFLTDSNKSCNDVLAVPYFNYFLDEFRGLNDIISNAKMQQKWSQYNIFSNNKSFNPLYDYGYENRSIIKKSVNEIKEPKNKDYKSPYEREYSAIKLFEFYLKEDKTYKDLTSKINKRIKEVFNNFSKTEVYELLSDSEKQSLQIFISSI